MNIQSLLSLLHLSSPGLPIGAFAYSQGLEAAVDLGWINDETTLHGWLVPLIRQGQANLDLPVMQRCYQACAEQRWDDLADWNQVLMTSRETRELLSEEIRIGQTLWRLMTSLDIPIPEKAAEWGYLPLYAVAAHHFEIDIRSAAAGWLWSWLENQITAACKTVPLGQTSAQKVLIWLKPEIEQAVESGLSV